MLYFFQMKYLNYSAKSANRVSCENYILDSSLSHSYYTPVMVVACFLLTMFSLCSKHARWPLSLIPWKENPCLFGRYLSIALWKISSGPVCNKIKREKNENMIITEWFCKVFKLIRRTIINSPVCLNRAICSRSFKSLLSFTSEGRFSNAEDSLFIHWRLLCSWAVRGWCPHRFVCPSSSVHSCSLHTWCRMDCHLHFSICMKQVLFTIIRLQLPVIFGL